MLSASETLRIRFSALALALAGLFFVLYPALRPFSDEASLNGAAAFASSDWLAAHMLATVAFLFVALGLHGVYSTVRGSAQDALGYWAFALGMIGVGFTLPFYGGEAFGLHAIGQEAIRQQSAALMGLAAVVRSGPGLIMFLVGLVLLAAAAVAVASVLWRSGKYPRWSGVPFAIGFALYIPQFFGTQALRVAHGTLVAIGCLWIAAALWAQGKNR